MYITRDKRAGDPLVGILGVTLVLLPQRKKKKQTAAV